MRTKTLLIAAAALAAGSLASQAQSNVYSANVVGYVNSSLTTTFALVATPLDNNGSNDLNSLLGTLPNKSSVQIWNGTGFTVSTKGGTAGIWTPDAVVPPGTGYFLKLPSGALTNTYTGQVVVNNGSSVTNTLVNGVKALVGSPIPYSDDLNDTNNYLGLLSLPNKSSIQTWNGSGYSVSTKGGTAGIWTPDVTITPGQGFFITAGGTAPTNWVQSLNLQ